MTLLRVKDTSLLPVYLTWLTVIIPVFACAQDTDTLAGKRPEEVYPGFFKKDPVWRGADGAASVDLGNGKVLWLFSDTFVSTDSSGTRTNATLIRNSIAIQQGYHTDSAVIKYYYGDSGNKPRGFFHIPGKNWLWTGNGVLLKDKLVIFLLEEAAIDSGLGFRAAGWRYAIIDNPGDNPGDWKIRYVKGQNTYGVLPGSAAILADDSFVYFYAPEEPHTHHVYLLRAPAEDILAGKTDRLLWWSYGKWITRKNARDKRAEVLFNGATEFSVHYDRTICRYIQVQAEGFGNAAITIRIAGNMEGPWSAPRVIYQPDDFVKDKIVYTARAHPELKGPLLITYNVNSLDTKELVNNENIYYPRFIKIDTQRIYNRD